jgi:outer membrane protein TolC
MIKINLLLLFAFIFLQSPVLAQEKDNILYIEQAVRLAQQNDPWIDGNRHMQDALKSRSIAAGSLPDPQVSLGLANLPTDSFSFNQDGMTQLKLGVSQMFPQGDSLNIKRRQLEIKSDAFPYLREDRLAKVSVTVGHLWLDAYKAKKTIALIEQDRSLFEQLSEIAMSSYSSAVGRTRQQDIIRAQLELTRLNDRITRLNQSKDMAMKKISEWFNVEGNSSADYLNFTVADSLPDTQIDRPEYIGQIVNDEAIYDQLSNHPMMSALAQKIKASGAGVDLARQKYKPAWGVNASYGRRNNDPFGGSRSDNISIGGVVGAATTFITLCSDNQLSSSSVSLNSSSVLNSVCHFLEIARYS